MDTAAANLAASLGGGPRAAPDAPLGNLDSSAADAGWGPNTDSARPRTAAPHGVVVAEGDWSTFMRGVPDEGALSRLLPARAPVAFGGGNGMASSGARVAGLQEGLIGSRREDLLARVVAYGAAAMSGQGTARRAPQDGGDNGTAFARAYGEDAARLSSSQSRMRSTPRDPSGDTASAAATTADGLRPRSAFRRYAAFPDAARNDGRSAAELNAAAAMECDRRRAPRGGVPQQVGLPDTARLGTQGGDHGADHLSGTFHSTDRADAWSQQHARATRPDRRIVPLVGHGPPAPTRWARRLPTIGMQGRRPYARRARRRGAPPEALGSSERGRGRADAHVAERPCRRGERGRRPPLPSPAA